MKHRAILPWTLALSLLTGCGGSVPVRPVQTPASPSESAAPVPSDAPVAVETEKLSANQLVLRLLEGECAQHPGENVIVSPLSIEMALGMAANGAANGAEESLRTLFGLNAEQLNRMLEPWMKREDGTLSIANGMWFNDKLTGAVSPEFREAVSSVYQAGEGTFQANSGESAQEINSWVKKQTRDKIDSIVTPDALKEETLGLLVNALYFNGKWVDPFEDYQVEDGKFRAAAGEQDASLMWETLDTYFESETASGFSKRYLNGYEFIGILPKEEEGAPDLSGLDLDAFLASETFEYDVDIRIPKFELSYEASLKKTLEEMGLGSLFKEHALDGVLTEEAKAAGMSAWVSDVLHKTYMKMHEQGTEAAAVTSVMMDCAMAAPPVERERKQVYLDRPFAFLIREVESGQIIFCGIISTVV